MPPELDPVKPPTRRNHETTAWLKAHGVIPVTPTTRSSDYDAIRADPFQYYLTRRLGLVPALSTSKALSRGSWFHTLFEHFTDDDKALLYLVNDTLESRRVELEALCDELGIKDDAKRGILAAEEKDAKCAYGWFCSARRVPILKAGGGGDLGTLLTYFQRPFLQTVRTINDEPAIELEITHKMLEFPKSPIVITIDRLIYHEAQNSLWIVDYKTCSETPSLRLQTCPLEFQTRLYLYVVQEALANGTLHNLLKLPPDVKLAGFIHVAVQKPTIEFGMKDRPFTLDTSPFKSGPRKGLPRNEKIYQGEPNIGNYIARCHDWYMGTGEYADKHENRETECPVGLSFTSASILDEDNTQELYSALKEIYHYATCEPDPINFPRSAKHLRAWGKLSPYAPFYLSPPASWPNVIMQDGFTVSHRDSDYFAALNAL